MSCYYEAVKPFREVSVYSHWNYGLVTELVEEDTRRALGTNIKEKILETLGMRRTTLRSSNVDHIAPAYVIDDLH